MSTRRNLWALLEQRPTLDRRALVLDQALLWLILINVAAVILESLPSLAARYDAVFRLIDAASVAIFTVEYAARVWVSVEGAPGEPAGATRLRYMRSPMAVIDLLAILPFYLGSLVGVDLRMLRALRLLRILKITRYFSGIQVLIDVLKAELRPMAAALFVMFVLMLIASSAIYWAEHATQPDAFGSIPESMWWTMVTLTTVGYGDVVPITPLGRLMGVVIMLLGIGMVALPAGMLASRFSEELHKRREDFGREVDELLGDGRLSGRDADVLDHLRETLSLSEAEAKAILETRRARLTESANCPHCGKPLPPAE